jgi:type I restriction enzyme S subunit
MSIIKSQLPKGWEVKKLGEVVNILDNLRKPITKKDRIEGEYPYYGATGILSYVHNYIFSEKLVLIGEDGAKWDSGDNTSFIADGKYWVNNHAHVIRPNRKIILDEWIVYFLNYSDLKSFITGMTVPKLNQEKMRSIPIPLPPLSEQTRIVSIIDKCFYTIDKAKANADKNLKNAKELFESYLQGVFGSTGSPTEKKGEKWEEKKLGEVCKIFNGGTPDTKVKEYWGGDNLWITPKDMGKLNSIYVEETNRKITDSGLKNSSAKILPQNSVILSSRAPIGHLAINTKPMSTNQGCKGIIPNKRLNSLFLYYFLKNSFQLLNELGSGTTFKELSTIKLSDVKISLPSISEQQKIVKRLDALSAETKRLEAIYQQKLLNLEEFKKSLLQKAFRGEL